MPGPSADRASVLQEGLNARQVRISVVIATHDSGRYIEETLKSVLAQTFQDFEVIVIDDGSTDRTHDIVERFFPVFHGRLHYVYQESRGLSAARNTGVRLARGRFIALLDADDLWMPDTLERLMKAMRDTGAGAVYANTEYFDADTGRSFGFEFDEDKGRLPCEGRCVEPLFLKGNFIPTMASLIRHEAFDAAGGFDEALGPGPADYDLWMRISSRYAISYHDRVLCRVRRQGPRPRFHPLPEARAQLRVFKKLMRTVPELRKEVSPLRIQDRAYETYYEFGRELILSGQGRRGRALMRKAWRTDPDPLNLAALLYIFLSFFPAPLVRKLRNLWRRGARITKE